MQFVVFLRHLDQRGGMHKRKRPDQDCIHDAEDRDAGADGEGDGENDGCREERRLAHDAEGVLDVIHGCAYPGAYRDMKLHQKQMDGADLVTNAGMRLVSNEYPRPGAVFESRCHSHTQLTMLGGGA